MLGDDDEDARAGVSDSKGPSSAPMAVEDVDWSALVSAQNTSDKTGTFFYLAKAQNVLD